jgi:ribosome biogenesis GTPase
MDKKNINGKIIGLWPEVINKLEKLGFDKWFVEKTDPEIFSNFQIARIFAAHKNSYLIHNGEASIFSEITGKIKFGASSPLDYPVVGDWVFIQYFDNESLAIIHGILPRRSLLKRKTSGNRIEYQPIASNIDFAFIMQSIDDNFNLRRLERYLVMANESGIQPMVMFSKSDLLSTVEIEKKLNEYQEAISDIPAVVFSSKTGAGIDKVKECLYPQKTYCLLGSSGVGKTTIINHLIGKENLKTQPVREKDGRGRHTTSTRQLFLLKNGSMLIDTPGMRELGNISVDAGIRETFQEITILASQCRYNDCTHIVEQGCAILQAVTDGRISKKRYDSYIKMIKESNYHEMSYLEKRKKDKEFGKFIKSVMKHKKRNKN